MTGYIGIGGTAKKIKNIYIGVGGVAKQVKKAYIGVGGAAKLWYTSKPSIADLFSHVQAVTYTQAGEANSKTYLPISLSSLSGFNAGVTAFCFLFCGGCFSVAKVLRSDTTPVTYDFTLLDTAYDTDFGEVNLVKYTGGTGVTDVRSDTSVFGVHFAVIFDNAYPVDEIANTLQNANKECLKYYYSSTTSRGSDSYASYQVGYLKSDVVAQSGNVFAAFASSNGYPSFSLSACATPLTNIWSYSNNASRSYPVLRSITYSSNEYLVPSVDSSATAETRSYSLFRISD